MKKLIPMVRWLALFAGVVVLIPACAPPPPVLRAILSSVWRVDLSWSSVDVARFTVERSTDGVSFVLLAELRGTARSWADTTAAGGTTYYYRVGGWYDEVAYSNVVAVTTPWAISYRGAGDEDFFALAPAGDGGFLAAGEIDALRTWQWDGWLVRVDARGSILWQKSLGTGKGEWIDHVEPAPDGGFLLVGVCGWTPGRGEGWVARLNAGGNVQWQYSLGGGDYDELLGAAATPDGGFILSGYTFSSGAGGSDLWLVKLSASGAVQWQRTYGGAFNEGASFTLQSRPTSDGGYVVVSAGDGPDRAGIEEAELWILKVRAQGQVDWAWAYGGAGLDYGFCVGEAANGDLLVAGTTNSFGAGGVDYWLFRFRSDGRVVWQRTYGGPEHDWVYAMQGAETEDGGLVVAGSGAGAGQDGWLLRLAADGTVGFNPASGASSWVTSVVPIPTNVRPRRLNVRVGTPGFVAAPYPASAVDTAVQPVRQAP